MIREQFDLYALPIDEIQLAIDRFNKHNLKNCSAELIIF